MTTLFIATGNAHKIEEIRGILSDSFQYRTLVDLPGAPKVVEDADSFAGNATKKAVSLANWIAQKERGWSHPQTDGSENPPHRGSDDPRSRASNLFENSFVLADDSGLEVDALNGAPGIYSARFAAMDGDGNSADADNNKKLLRLLENVPLEKRTARFRCVIALTPIVKPAGGNQSPVCLANEAELQTEIFEGTCEGIITLEPKGQGGFGYDPLFAPNGYAKSYAELGEEIKNQISHRARALEKLKLHLRNV